jgi:hypothetical protein
MNSELSRVLKKEFHKRMAADLPEFQKAGTESGGVIYRRHDVENSRYIFIFLEPNPKSDRFTLELATATVPKFPFNLLPGEQEPPREVRYRIRTFLEKKSDGWWNVNVSESQYPDLDAIMKTLQPEAIQKGLSKLPKLVEDAFKQLQSILPKFMATLPREEVVKGWSPLSP